MANTPEHAAKVERAVDAKASDIQRGILPDDADLPTRQLLLAIIGRLLAADAIDHEEWHLALIEALKLEQRLKGQGI